MEDFQYKARKPDGDSKEEMPVHLKIQTYSLISEKRQAKFITDLRKRHKLAPNFAVSNGFRPETATDFKNRLLSMSLAIAGTANSIQKSIGQPRSTVIHSTVYEKGVSIEGQRRKPSLSSMFLAVPNSADSVKNIQPIIRKVSDLSEKSLSFSSQGRDYTVEELQMDDTDRAASKYREGQSIMESISKADWTSVRSASVNCSKNMSNTSLRSSKMDIRLSALGYSTSNTDFKKRHVKSISRSRMGSNVIVCKGVKSSADGLFFKITGKNLGDSTTIFENVLKCVYLRDLPKLKEICHSIRESPSQHQNNFFHLVRNEDNLLRQIINRQDCFGLTALGLAALLYTDEKGTEVDIVRYLVTEGATAQTKSLLGNDPFHSAVLNVA